MSGQQTQPPVIRPGGWSGYREYIGPHGEMILYIPSLGDEPPQEVLQSPGGGPLRDDAPPPPAHADDGIPRTIERPGTGTAPPAQPQQPPGLPQPSDGSDDVDEEMRRHREWLRHRFDPPQPPKPDPTKPGTYQRMHDEAADTARRIAALEQERYDSTLPDWLWDQLFGQELRILLVHLRALRWQIEEFEKAHARGDDPVEAVNRYNREQWEIFLRALYDHMQLLGLALTGIDAVRGFQQAMEEILQGAQATHRRQAGEWERRRTRARAAASEGGGGGGGDEPPPGGGGPRAPNDERIGGLTRREWRRARIRKHVNDMNKANDPRWQEANREYKAEFPSDGSDYEQYGETMGVVTISEDGTTADVVTWQLSPDGVVSDLSVQEIPVSELPESFGLGPDQSYGFNYTNDGPR